MAGKTTNQITIIGAGPAGLTAALMLGKQGIPSLLIEKHQFPREKICGDGLGGKVVSCLHKIDPDFVRELEMKDFATGSHAVRFFSPSAKMMELSFRHEKAGAADGFICQRMDFDNFLMEKAQANPNIHIQQGVNIKGLHRKNGNIIIQDESGQTIAETVLLLMATGMDNRLIQQLGPEDDHPGREGIGVRGYFKNVSGSDNNFAIEIHFLEELLPWYFWIFPFSDGSANVGLAMPEEKARESQSSLKELLFHVINKYPHLKSRFSGSTLSGKIKANRLPYYNYRGSIAGDNYLLLGDAARLVDPFTGEGIGNAMYSGIIAAEIAGKCFETGNTGLEATKNYQQLIYQKLGPELELSLKLQKLAQSRRLLNLVIGRASANKKLRMTISEMLYNDKAKSKLSNPWFYLKLMLGL
jgi:menaquinone-9 beta-reductase